MQSGLSAMTEHLVITAVHLCKAVLAMTEMSVSLSVCETRKLG